MVLVKRKSTPFALALKLAVLGFLALALAEPGFFQKNEAANALLLLDISNSMDVQQANSALAILKPLQDKDVKIKYFAFASALSPELESALDYQSLLSQVTGSNRAATNLENALQFATQAKTNNILLISDAYQTTGNFEKIIPKLNSLGKQIFPLLGTNSSSALPNFSLSNLDVNSITEVNKLSDIRVSVKNTSTSPQIGRLQVSQDGKIVWDKEVSVPAQYEQLVSTNSLPAKEGISEIKASFLPSTKNFQASSLTAYLSTNKKERILLLSSSEADARFLEQALRNAAYVLDSKIEMERDISFSDYSALIFNNVPYSQLPVKYPAALEQFVRMGGGFVMIGGNKSFGLGGYKDTLIEDILPVQLVDPRAAEKRLNIALELLLDKSQSMAAGNKIDFAKDAANQAIQSLKDDDFVGVIGFDSTPFEVVKLGRLSEIRETALERVGRLFPNNKTNLFPAMHEGRRRLEAVKAGRKHMIILTDGKLPDGGQHYVELVKQMRLMGITVSTVLVGAESDFGLLREMAESGGGAFYQTADAQSLPRIFINDIKVRSGELSLKENYQYRVRGGPGRLESVNIDEFPILRGYVETKAKSAANYELAVQGPEKSEPLLVSWKYGKGHALAFTSDASGRWSSYWVGWPKFAVFWSELLDSLRASATSISQNVKFDVKHSVTLGNLNIDISVYSPVTLSAELKTPDGKEHALALEQLAAGHFEARKSDLSVGKYELRLSAGMQKLTPVAFYVAEDDLAEKKGLGFNMPVLKQLAAQTGGRINPKFEELQSDIQNADESDSLHKICLSLALFFFILDIMLREFSLIRFFRRSNKTLTASST